MKIFLIIFAVIFSLSCFSATKYHCQYNDFRLNVFTIEKTSMNLEIFKNEKLISTCYFKVTSYDNGETGVSSDQLYKFEMSGCKTVYDKIFSKINILKKGFIKISPHSNISLIKIIENEAPLNCQ